MQTSLTNHQTDGVGFYLMYKARECGHDNNNGICMKGDVVALFSLFPCFAINASYFVDCGGNYSDTSGLVTSPSFPSIYPNNADCTYIITVPRSAYVKLTLISMDISCHSIESDYIDVIDGVSKDSPLIGRFCGDGSNVPATMQTTQNYLRIR